MMAQNDFFCVQTLSIVLHYLYQILYTWRLIVRSLYLLQEEYVAGDEVGRLQCEHSYHAVCVNQWLRLKNWCPICKAAASTAVAAAAPSPSPPSPFST